MVRRLAALLVLLAASPAWADSVVTHCTRDIEPVTDVDLGIALSRGGHVTFACPPGSVIEITRVHTMAQDTWIDGGGLVTLDARNATAMFVVSNPSVVLRMSGLTIRGARPAIPGAGGIVTGAATVEITGSTLVDNGSPFQIGTGTLRLTDSEIRNGTGVAIAAANIALTRARIYGNGLSPFMSSGGTVEIRYSQIAASGSSVFSNCRLRIYSTTWSSSTSSAVDTACETTVDLSHFHDNHGEDGGAILLRSAAPSLAVRGGDFTGNTAEDVGGAIAAEPVDAPRPIEIRNVVFRGNRAFRGAAVNLGSFLENQQVLTLKGAFFVENTAASSGGAIEGTNVALHVTRSVFAGNRAGNRGGAIYLELFAPRDGTIANSLFTRNVSPRGSAYVGSGTRFVNVTVASNEGGPAIAAFWPTASVNAPPEWRLIRVENSVFYRNAPQSCETTAFGKLITDRGSNLQFPAGGCPPTIPTADPAFDTLFVPAWGGAADGKGNVAACVAQPVAGTDLYGRHRPQGQGCSIGAVEGDIEDVVLERHPEWADLPKAPPSTCPCDTRPPPKGK